MEIAKKKLSDEKPKKTKTFYYLTYIYYFCLWFGIEIMLIILYYSWEK